MSMVVALPDAPAQRPAPRIPAPPTSDTSSRHVLLVPLRWVTESIVSGTRVQYTLSCGHVAQRHYTKNFPHQVAYCPQCATHGIPVPYPLAEGARRTGDALPPSRLRDARVQAGLSQRQLGEKLGVSRSQVTKWESEGLSIPHHHRMQITSLLGVIL